MTEIKTFWRARAAASLPSVAAFAALAFVAGSTACAAAPQSDALQSGALQSGALHNPAPAAMADPASAEGSAVSPEADGVAQAVTAAQVAAWGRAHQDPGALIMAARILAEVPMRPAPDQGTDRAPVLALAPPVSPGAYLDEAATLAAGNQGVLDAIEHLRGASRGVRSSPFGQGPIFMVREIKARETYWFEVEARGGEVLRVAAIGDGDTNIDLSVRDAGGALVCQDGFGDHYPVCTVPRARAGKMRIDIVNRGGVWTKVQILSN